MQRYEYKFVRLEQKKNWLVGEMPSKSALTKYAEQVAKHAKQGWRLVQIFTPPMGPHGLASYYELILERPVE